MHSERLFNTWRRVLVQWERQHKYLTWYVAAVSTIVLVLLVAERL